MGNFPKALIAGGIAGIVGAAIWAAIAYFFNLEIGWIAWLIGGMIGLAVASAGRRGSTTALLAAALTVLSICGGKIASVHFGLEKYVAKELNEAFTMENYNEAKEDAEIFSKINSPEQYSTFMVERGYTEAPNPSKITQEELDWFKEYSVPSLREFAQTPPSYEQWKKEQTSQISSAIRSQLTFWDMLKGTLGLMDIVFFFLGVGTAYQIALGKENAEETTEDTIE